MDTYLLTWNPDQWPWPASHFATAIRRTADGDLVTDRWSTGVRTTGIGPGDRAFLLRQGAEPRGLVASGWFTSDVRPGPHWDNTPNKKANYAELSWDAVLGDDLIPITDLAAEVGQVNWEPRAGGTLIGEAAADQLEAAWASHLSLLGRSSQTPSTVRNAWLLRTVGDDRQHGGNEGYDDDPAVTYRWDSTVAHHADLAEGDAIVLWDKKASIGAAVIESISSRSGSKVLHKCPHCGKAGIKARKTQTPKYKCYKCKGVFDQPSSKRVSVTRYETRHNPSWVDLTGVLTAAQLRRLCKDPKSQQSMRPLRWDKLQAAMLAAGQQPIVTTLTASAGRIAGGHQQRTVRVRIGQRQFREALIKKYGPTCAFTGVGPLATLEAGHLYSYAKAGEHHDDGGLLLRRDVHRLFDLGFLAVEPVSATLDVHPSLAAYPTYGQLHGQGLHVQLSKRQLAWVQDHWTMHRK